MSEFWLQIKQREVEMLVVKLETRIENKVEDDILANGPSSSYRIVRELLAVQSIQSSPAGNEENQRWNATWSLQSLGAFFSRGVR